MQFDRQKYNLCNDFFTLFCLQKNTINLESSKQLKRHEVSINNLRKLSGAKRNSKESNI